MGNTLHLQSLRTLSIFIAVLLGVPPSAAEEPAPTDARGDDEIRIREVFSSHLPDTIRESLFRASVHPHFGDFGNHDYFRVSNSVRYGLTSKLEISAGLDVYASHGLGDVGFFNDVGVMAVEFGAKRNMGHAILDGWDSAIGFDTAIAVGTPPAEVTDGLDHYSPYITFSRRLESRRNIRVFWGVGFDFVADSGHPGELRDNEFADDSVHATAGFVIDRGMLHYSFETLVGTTEVIGESSENLLEFRPGLIWEVPQWKNRQLRSGWMIGIAPRVSFGHDGTDFGLAGKLRYNFDLKRLFRRDK